ncbi:hypothetical protein [Vibrio sinaloensis]|uniref:hypothetical protein n=1 Tax=Photobacterium sp. (strain ATCC 43367) TaxID=379097 RepID=UPI002068CF52|nr:hypothetical protein [Vibrio sinaloensis]UPQ89517.1 hypothetical protein MTO69_17325 [Vibrio sinaloensis]
MKRSLLALLLAGISAGAMANQAPEQQEVNYGDPTASFSTVGISGTQDKGQVNMMYGAGANIFQLDLGFDNTKDADGKRPDSKDAFNYRGRYFHVTDGLGYSVDVMGSADSTTVLGGAIYKFTVTDNVMVFPMLSAGYSASKDGKNKIGLEKDSAIAQAGLYAMYGFDSGHWLYANPKTTYHVEGQEFTNQVEVGGGYMLTDNISVGFKVEHTGKIKGTVKNGLGVGKDKKEDTVTWLQANYYF